KHVLSSIPIHSLAATKVLKGTLDAIKKGIADFFWGWYKDKKNLHWVSWKRIAAPKDKGMLGIK
ncbi:hypothetical protein PJI17_32280, partial [Mycobacterium kansasii]